MRRRLSSVKTEGSRTRIAWTRLSYHARRSRLNISLKLVQSEQSRSRAFRLWAVTHLTCTRYHSALECADAFASVRRCQRAFEALCEETGRQCERIIPSKPLGCPGNGAQESVRQERSSASLKDARAAVWCSLDAMVAEFPDAHGAMLANRKECETRVVLSADCVEANCSAVVWVVERDSGSSPPELDSAAVEDCVRDVEQDTAENVGCEHQERPATADVATAAEWCHQDVAACVDAIDEVMRSANCSNDVDQDRTAQAERAELASQAKAAVIVAKIETSDDGARGPVVRAEEDAEPVERQHSPPREADELLETLLTAEDAWQAAAFRVASVERAAGLEAIATRLAFAAQWPEALAHLQEDAVSAEDLVSKAPDRSLHATCCQVDDAWRALLQEASAWKLDEEDVRKTTKVAHADAQAVAKSTLLEHRNGSSNAGAAALASDVRYQKALDAEALELRELDLERHGLSIARETSTKEETASTRGLAMAAAAHATVLPQAALDRLAQQHAAKRAATQQQT